MGIKKDDVDPEVKSLINQSLPEWARTNKVDFSDDLETIRRKVEDRVRASRGFRELGITKESILSKPPKPGQPSRIKTLFGLQYTPLWRERPVIVGSLSELGKWCTAGCLKADEVLEKSGFWICQTDLPAGQCYRWKWAMMKDGEVLWTEEMTRRGVVCFSPSLVTVWGFDELGEVTTRLDTLPLEDTKEEFSPWHYCCHLFGLLLRATFVEIKGIFL